MITPVQRALAAAERIRAAAEADEDSGIFHAAGIILQNFSTLRGQRRLTLEQAEDVVRQYIMALLNNDQFEAAATILWGSSAYDWTPLSSRETWRCLFEHDKLLIQGAGAMGKSYGAGAWFYLDWYRDPAWTAIKVVSLTREHAERNIFASIRNFHRSALVRPLTEVADDLQGSLQVTPDSKQGIHLVAIPKGESGHGTLRGFHPSPRSGPEHPRWGRLSRTHVVLDEAEEIPAGVWEGINNILSTVDLKHDRNRVKIFAASNPKDRTSDFGQRCEPERGWGSVDCEEDWEWESGMGFHVLRLDAARCENVVERRIIHHGLQTYEGFMSYMKRGHTAEAMTMARGWFPEEGAAMAIIGPNLMDKAMGIVRFIGPVVPLAAFDLALEGNDKVMCSHGRYGLSDGWKGLDGTFKEFPDGPRNVLQLDAQMPFPKKPTLEQAEAISAFCREMKIAPSGLIVDRTGNGAGIHDVLCSRFGEDTMGLNFSSAASDIPIFADDSRSASELYNGVVTELVFGVARWVEFEYLKIRHGHISADLVSQATARRYKQKGLGLVRVESKEEYCKRTRRPSPDALDSLSLLVYLVRHRFGVEQRMLKEKPQTERFVHRSVIDESNIFVDFSD